MLRGTTQFKQFTRATPFGADAEAGFTMFELLISFAISALLIFAIVAVIGQFTDRNKVLENESRHDVAIRQFEQQFIASIEAGGLNLNYLHLPIPFDCLNDTMPCVRSLAADKSG